MIKQQTYAALLTASLCIGLSTLSSAQSSSLRTYANDRFGYTLVYPAEIFQPAPAGDLPAEAEQEAKRSGQGPAPRNDAGVGGEAPVNEDGRTFVSLDGRTKMIVFGAFNSENFNLTEYRSTILKEFQGYDNITYGPKGRTWFVLSGFRGDAIYYQKVLFSCSSKVINALSITFPREQKPIYEPIIERLEDNFRTARGRSCDLITGRG